MAAVSLETVKHFGETQLYFNYDDPLMYLAQGFSKSSPGGASAVPERLSGHL